jgi:hypothetical protein
MFQALTLLRLGHSLSSLESHENVLITDDFLSEKTNTYLQNRSQPFPSTLLPTHQTQHVNDVAIEYKLPLL